MATTPLATAAFEAPSALPAWPPAPHDPRERELAHVIAGWEVRLFGGRHFQYFVTRGFWHLQLWNPTTRVSVLTPSRLTRGFYEVFPIEDWKAIAPDYARLVLLVRDLPAEAELRALERAFVDDVVRDATDRRRRRSC